MNKSFDIIIFAFDELYFSNGPLYVASILENHGYSVKVIHAADILLEHEIDLIIEKYIVNEKQIIGFSTTFLRQPYKEAAARKLVEKISNKIPNFKCVVGGSNNMLTSDIFPSNAKFIMGQNRENEIIDVFNLLSGKIKKIPFSFLTHSINYKTLFPTPIKGVIMYLELSKGCIFNCSFCDYHFRKSKSQFKSKEQLIFEIEQFYSIFKTADIHVLCSTFNDDEEKIKTVLSAAESLSFTPRFFVYTRLDLLINQSETVKLFYKKYVKYVWLGIESLEKQSLKIIGKSTDVEKTKKSLINIRQILSPDTFITASFIIGLPGSDPQTTIDNINWVYKNNIVDAINISPLRINVPDIVNSFTHEFSEFDLNPQKFGFKVYETIENDAKMFKWLRTDGYSSDLAINDATKILNQIKNPLGYIFQMRFFARFGAIIPVKLRINILRGIQFKFPDDLQSNAFLKMIDNQNSKLKNEYYQTLI